MKVDLNAAKPCTSELPPMCAATINEFKNAGSDSEFIEQLNRMKEWQSVIGKTEMIRWVEVLDRCDSILEGACKRECFQQVVDTDVTVANSVIAILRFTALLFENTSTRSVYASSDRLLSLLDCSNMDIVNEVLRLFLIISKRSHFLRNKLPVAQQITLVSKLTAIAQCWFKRLKSIKMCDVVKEDLQIPALFPFTFEDSNGKEFNIDKPDPSEPLFSVLFKLNTDVNIDLNDTVLARLRTLRGFEDITHRMQTLAARLIAISTLMYARIQHDDLQLNSILYDGFVEECAELLKLDTNLHPLVDTLKAEGLRTLTSLVAQEKQPKLQQVIDSLGASSYHGFLAVLTRQCVDDLRAGQLGQPCKASVALCTALFSLLYHMSGLDSGGEAIVACGLMQTLISVVSCHSLPIDHITFVTRCVRVIDIVTAIDVQGFHQARGMDACVERLMFEVDECRKEQPFTVDVTLDKEDDSGVNEYVRCPSVSVPCHQQRSALIKSLLNFVKRVIQDNQFADSTRHIMEGNLPEALMHIISNADYYTASLYHNAIQLVTNFIYQEPTQLTQLQQRHVPYVILQSLLRKEIPASRDVINNMANTFTALCLNDRGLAQLKAYDPFNYVFKVVLSLKFITAMKRKRSELNDVAIGIGSALDDLLRHQPSLRTQMLQAILAVLKNLLEMGSMKEPKIVMCLSRSAAKSLPTNTVPVWLQQREGEGSSDSREPSVASGVQSPREEESEDEDDVDSNQAVDTEETSKGMADLGLEIYALAADGTRVLPLGEYLLIFGKIMETMITQNASADMVDGVVEGGGVELLLALFQIAPIRMEVAHSALPSTVANILKFLLQHSSNQRLLHTVMASLCESLAPLAQLNAPISGSVGVLSQMGSQALADALTSVTNATAVLSSLSKTAITTQEDLRNRVLSAWNEEAGQQLIDRLHTVFRVICGEMAVYNVVQNSSKVSCTTQTDPTDVDVVVDMETTISQQSNLEVAPSQYRSSHISRTHVDGQPADAVQTESAPPRKPSWEVAGLSALEKEFWHGHKIIAVMMSKAQKNLTDLLGQLGRICLRPQGRSRRGYEAVGPISKQAKALAETLFKKYRDAMQTTAPPSMITNTYLTDLLDQLCVTVFDERKHPHLSLLSMFYRSGIHKAFCQMLVDIIAPQFKKGQNDASVESLMLQWIRLADRLSNKPNVINSRNRTNEVGEFPPEKYHKLVQTDLFTAFNQLFAALSSDEVDLKANMRSCELAIAIYKEVVRNLVALRDDSVPSRRSSDMPNPADLVDPNHLQMLMDMGFERDSVVQALMECSTVAEATDYLIANQDADMGQALQEALRSNREGRPRAELATDGNRLTAGGSTGDEPIAIQSIPSSSIANTAPTSPSEGDIQALSKLHIDFNIEQAISRTCNEMIPLCKKLMDAGSDLVYSTADLVIGVVDSCDQQWKQDELIKNGMCVEIRELAEGFMSNPQCQDTARSLATRLHFACLLWEHIAEDYIKVLSDVPVRQTLTRLLNEVVRNPVYEQHCQEKGVLSPLLLWLDLYEKCCRLIRRKDLLVRVVGDAELKWSYYGWEERFGAHGKWTNYPPNLMSLISNAFVAGRPKVSFKMNKKDYTLNFADMTQKSDGGNGVDKNIVNVELPENAEVDLEKIAEEESQPVWSVEESAMLMSSLTALLHKGKIHHTVAHSILLLVARLTSVPFEAEEFVRLGGINAILQVRCATTPSTSALLAIIVRQCVDDDPMLSQMFERTIRSVAGGSHSSHMHNTLSSRWNPTRNSAMRDWKSSLYVLTPLIGRSHSLYCKTMGRVAKISNGEMGAQPGISSAHTSSSTHPNPQTQHIVEMLLREAVFGEWPTNDIALASTNGRMVTRGTILNVVSELVRSYGCVALVVTELKQDGHSLLYKLIDTHLEDTTDKDRHGAITCLVGTLAGCNHASKAQEALVNDVKAVLSNISLKIGQSENSNLINKIAELANLVTLMRDACPSTHPHLKPGQPQPQNTNNIVRLLYKKRVCNELVRAITQLPFQKKEAVDTVNQVLKTLDEITKNINQMMAPHDPTPSTAGTSGQSAVSTNTAGGSGNAQPTASTSHEGNQVVINVTDHTLQEVSFSVQPDAAPHAPNLYDEEDDEDGEVDTIDDENEDHDDFDDDDGGRALVEDGGSEESASENEDEEETEDNGDGHHDTLNDVDDNMANDDADELVEDSMSSGDEDHAVVDETMGDADPDEDDDHRVEQMPADVVEEDSEMDEDEDDDEFGRFVEEIDNDVRAAGVFTASDFLDAHVLLDGRVDDFDFIAPHLGQLRSQIQNRNVPQHEHPLLVRPSGIPDSNRREPVVSNPTHTRYNMVIERAQRHGVLQRQGAVRGRNSIGTHNNMNFFDQIFDLANVNGRSIFDLRPRPLINMIEGLNPHELGEGHSRFVAICSGLERLTEGACMLDQHSLQFLAVLINHGITKAAIEKEKAEKEQSEKDKAAADNKKSKTVDNTDGSSMLQELADQNRFEELERFIDESGQPERPSAEEHMDTSDAGFVHVDDVETPMEEAPSVAPQLSQGEEMSTDKTSTDTPTSSAAIEESRSGDSNIPCSSSVEAVPINEQLAEAMDETPLDVEPQALSTSNAFTSNPIETENTESTLTATNLLEVERQNTDNTQSNSVVTDEPTIMTEVTGSIRVPEEYRDILGDIEIPSGVDPAFLAALPDDMRAEVLRDHERQQRAQRATQQRPTGVTAISTNSTEFSTTANSAMPVIPGVEPLDQDFLNALPPELQEEILAQHERAVRDAQAAAAAAANPQPPAAPAVDDAVAVIESLPPGLRAQVLADADDSVLAALPANVVEEARRLRTQLDHHSIRFQQRMVVPRRGYIPRGTQGANGVQVGGQAGHTATANSNAVQVLDRDSIVTLVMMYLIDNSKLSVARLQKVIRSVCSHAGSCDFVIWCLLSMLNKATDGDNDDDIVCGPSSWIDSISVSGGGNIERALKIGKDASTVFINSAINVNVSKNILDTFVVIAKAYPGHFLPGPLRVSGNEQTNAVNSPPLSQFWSLVQQHGHVKSKETPLHELKYNELEKSPIAMLMDDLVKPVVQKNTPLQDRLLKVVSSVVQTLPNDTLPRLGLTAIASPLQHQLRSLVQLMTDGRCSQEGLSEGRTLLVETMRALSQNTASLIYDLLFESVESLGAQLRPQIKDLLKQLGEIESSSAGTDSPTPRDQSECSKARRVQVSRYDGVIVDGDASGRPLANASTCEELQLPAVSALTEKLGVQQSLLSSLHTVCKVRDTMRIMREQVKKEEERKKKEEEEQKKKDQEKVTAASEPKVVEPEQALAQIAASSSTTSSQFAELAGTSSESGKTAANIEEIRLSEKLVSLDDLWTTVSDCLGRLGKASDAHAVLALQPAAEAFFLVHAVSSAASDHDHPDTKKLIHFAEKHRSVLNQVLRQNPAALAEGGPFTVLTQLPKLLDFDVKRKFFRKQLSNQDENRAYRRDDIPVRVRRNQIFAESYRELFRLRPHEWKNRFYILFDGEEGQDAGGLLREWFSVITREIFNPNYALFITSPGDRVTYMINKASYINPEHIDYFKFVGRIIAKAVHDNKLLDCYFTRAFYKHILNLPVRYQDLESEDPSFYNSLQFLLENPINELGMDLTFSLEVEEFGVREFRDLKPGGQDIAVTDENKDEYVKLVCQMKMTGSIRKQLDAFLSGFYEVIPKNLIAMFNEQELELLISGLPEVDIDDLSANTEYRSYSKTSPQIQWFWRALRSFEQEDRAKFLQFVTGTSKVPLQGFASLEGMNGVQKFSIHMDSRSGDRLPAAHTCFNQLDLPQYESYEKLRESLLTAIRECTEGFGFA